LVHEPVVDSLGRSSLIANSFLHHIPPLDIESNTF
jgi:hypothetical protein